MKRMFRRLMKEESGATLVLVAIGMTVFMGITALVTDVGIIYLEKAKLANAMDAATLAGIQELPGSPTAARNVVNQYAALNGVDPSALVVTIGSDNKSLTVQGNGSVNLLFAKVLGYNTKQVTASAKATVGALKSATGAVPFSIQDQTLVYGQEYILKEGDGTNGWFQAIALGGHGASIYENNIKYGYSGTITIGTNLDVETEPGNKSGPTANGVNYRINADPHYPKCTASNFQRDCPRIVTVLVVLPPDGGGRTGIEIKGFASFLLTEASPGSGNESIVKGYFINNIASGEIDTSLAGYGLNGVKLTE